MVVETYPETVEQKEVVRPGQFVVIDLRFSVRPPSAMRRRGVPLDPADLGQCPCRRRCRTAWNGRTFWLLSQTERWSGEGSMMTGARAVAAQPFSAARMDRKAKSGGAIV